MKKAILILAAVAIVLSGCSKAGGNSAAAKPKTQYMTFGAPPASSALFPYWVSVGKAISTTNPEFQITVSESQGAVDLAKRLRNGDIIVGNCVSSTDYDNYNGTGTFRDSPNKDLRILWYYETTPEQFAVAASSGVKTLAELNEKKFNPGGTGTSAAAITFSILKLLKIQPNYFEAGQADAADAFSNRQIIGTVKLGPVNDSYVMQLIAAQPTNLISMTPNEIELITTAYPYLIDFTIPGGTYKGIDQDVRTVATIQGAQTSVKLSPEDGYKMIKAMCEDGKQIWQTAYAQGANNDILALTLKSAIPLHAGTVKYLKEKGYDVPAKLIPPEYKD